MNLQLQYGGNPPATYQPVDIPEWPRYAQVKNHVEMFGINILDYTNVPKRFNGIPSVFQLIQTATQKPVTLTRPLQEWIFSLFLENAPVYMTRAEVVKCWANAFMSSKAFTNGVGWDKIDEETGEYLYADFIQGTGETREGFKLQPVISHGSTVKVLRPPFAKAGIMQAEIEVLDAFDPNTLKLNYRDNRHVIFPAVNWYRFPLPDGISEPFPKLDGRDVPIPMLGNHTTVSYIDAAWLRFLSPEEVPAQPYWPRL